MGETLVPEDSWNVTLLGWCQSLRLLKIIYFLNLIVNYEYFTTKDFESSSFRDFHRPLLYFHFFPILCSDLQRFWIRLLLSWTHPAWSFFLSNGFQSNNNIFEFSHKMRVILKFNIQNDVNDIKLIFSMASILINIYIE